MDIMLFSGTSSLTLAEMVAGRLGISLGRLNLHSFPDGELSIEVMENVRGKDIYLLQSTSPPVANNLLELLLLADSVFRSGAERITALIPYFGYARQDRRVTGTESIGAHLIARLFEASQLSGIVTVDLHNSSLEGFFDLSLNNITSVPLLAEAARRSAPDVVVAPDLGATKLAEHYAALLDIPLSIVHKARISSTEVKVHSVVGDVYRKRPLIVDDMISTAGTIEASANALLSAGCLPEISVAVTHGLLAGKAVERLQRLPLKHLYLTDSISRHPVIELPVEEVSLGPLLAEVVRRLDQCESLADLLVHL